MLFRSAVAARRSAEPRAAADLRVFAIGPYADLIGRPAAPAVGASGFSVARILRLARKELREILRDRRTIVTLLVMPMIVYPLLALVFQRFLLTSLSAGGKVEYIVGTDSERSAGQLIRQLESGEAAIKKRAVGVTIRISAANASPMPAPTAAPFTAAITG